MAQKKVQISIDDDLLNRIDNYADNNYMTRSGLITFATNQFLNSNEIVHAIQDLSLSIRRVADNGVVDTDTMKRIEEFELIAKLFVNGGN